MRPKLLPNKRIAHWSACQITCVAALAITLVRPTTARPLDLARHLPPADASYVAEEVRVKGPGHYSLGGTLTLPARGVLRNGHVLRYPAIVLLSGASKQDRDGVAAEKVALGEPRYRPLFDLADTLTRRGIVVMRLDDRGVGASTGALVSITTLDRAGDARAALEYLRRRPEIDPQRIAVLGMSEGASIATLLAAGEPRVSAVVLMASPPLPGREIARGVSVPALVMQGDADRIVRPEGAEALAGALRTGNPDVTLRRLPGLDHSFLRVADFVDGRPVTPAALRLPATVRGAVADWLAAKLGGPVEGPAPQVSRRRHRR